MLEYGVDQWTCGPVVARAFPEIQPGKVVSADWTWEMKQSGSQPPGSKIWWLWHITDDQGKEIVTNRKETVWLDDQHDWQTQSGDDINLHGYDGGSSFGRDLHTSAVESLNNLGEVTLLAEVIAYLERAVEEHDAVIVSDYRKGVITASLMKSLVALARARRIFVAVDPKVGHFHLYRNVSLVTPNIAEASQGSGIEIRDDKSLVRAGTALLKKLSCDSVLITRGEEGMSFFERGRAPSAPRVVHIPTVAKKVFDVTGAGDTVIAALTLARAAGATLEGSARIANYAAGIVVREVGTAVVTPRKLL